MTPCKNKIVGKSIWEDWQPIDTAPRNGMLVDLCWMDDGKVQETFSPMYWNGRVWQLKGSELVWSESEDGGPTHWRASRIQLIKLTIQQINRRGEFSSSTPKYLQTGLVARAGMSAVGTVSDELRDCFKDDEEVCPYCGNALDTGFECNSTGCLYDAQEVQVMLEVEGKTLQ